MPLHPRFQHVTQEHLTRAARSISPKQIQKWSCLLRVNGKQQEFPVKQILMEAANLVAANDPSVTPQDFTAHDAVRMLKKLGLDVYYEGKKSI
jgi:hypothetical protein